VGSSVILPQPGQPKTGPDPTFKTAATPNFTTFGFKEVAPPSPLYLQRDDVILVRSFTNQAGVSTRVNFRLLIPYQPTAGQPVVSGAVISDVQPVTGGSIIRGSLVFPLTPGGGPTLQELSLGEGYLLGLVLEASGLAPAPGQVYDEALLFQGPALTGINGQLLCAGYVTGGTHLGWPGVTRDLAQGGPGWIHSIQQANPGAGADWTYTLAGNVRQRIQSFSSQLTTSATAGNRLIQLVVDDGVNTVWAASAPAAVAASTTQTFTGAGSNSPTGAVTTIFSVVIPPDLVLTTGMRIRSSTVGLLAGDQWANIWLLVEEWFAA
jgi:hypothetical protein